MALALAGALILGGCAFLGEDDANVPETVTDREEGSGYPNLASVPNQPPEVTPPEQRTELMESLTADRAEARYSDEPLIPPGTDGIRTAPAADGVVPGGESEPIVISPEGVSAPAASGPSAQSVVNPAGFVRDGPRTLIAVIYFDHSSTSLDQADRDVLRSVADLQKERGGRLLVFGHASQRTTTSDASTHQLANFETSFDRAASVSRYLQKQGIEPDDVISIARGSKDPVYYEFMPTGEAGNRRAEIYLER